MASPEAPLATEPGACALCGGRTGAPLARGWDFEYGTTHTELTLHRCACGGVYLDPRPSPSELARIYPSNYYAYDFQARLGPLVARVKGATERAKVSAYAPYLRESSRILDVGCGDGHLLALIRDTVAHRVALEGVDVSADAAIRARARGIMVHVGAIETVDLADGAYDLIVMNQLIEHVGDPGGLLRRVIRGLRPGGHLFIETPNLDALDARLFRRRYWGGYHLPRHFHLFDRRTLPRLMAQVGLDTVAMRPLVNPQFWIITIQNWLSAHGRRDVAQRWVSPFSPLWLAPFTAIEVLQARLWWTSNVQLVARRP